MVLMREWGWAGPSVAMEIMCPLIDHSELCTGHQHMKICQDLSNSKKMVFNFKKLLNDGGDMTQWRRGRKKRSQHVLQIQADDHGFRWQTGQCQCPLKAFETAYGTLGSKRHILTENTSSIGFSAGPHCQDHLAVVSRILDSSKLAAIFTRLKPVGHLYLDISQVKVRAMSHANLAAKEGNIWQGGQGGGVSSSRKQKKQTLKKERKSGVQDDRK